MPYVPALRLLRPIPMPNFYTLVLPELCTSNAEPIGTSVLAYRIGGISFGMFSGDDAHLTLDPALQDFAMNPLLSEACDANMRVSSVDTLPGPDGSPSF